MSLSVSDWLKNLENPPVQEKSSPCQKKKGDCLKVIQYIIDGEASPEQQQHFDKHIVECMQCFEQYNLDKSIKQAIKTKISKKEVPLNLIEEIKFKVKNII